MQRCSRPLPEVAGIKATQLFAKNADVDAVNRRELDALPGELVSHLLSRGDSAPWHQMPLPMHPLAVQIWGEELNIDLFDNATSTKLPCVTLRGSREGYQTQSASGGCGKMQASLGAVLPVLMDAFYLGVFVFGMKKGLSLC